MVIVFILSPLFFPPLGLVFLEKSPQNVLIVIIVGLLVIGLPRIIVFLEHSFRSDVSIPVSVDSIGLDSLSLIRVLVRFSRVSKPFELFVVPLVLVPLTLVVLISKVVEIAVVLLLLSPLLVLLPLIPLPTLRLGKGASETEALIIFALLSRIGESFVGLVYFLDFPLRPPSVRMVLLD